MKSIIDEIYYGNLYPQEIPIPEKRDVDRTAFDEYINSLDEKQGEAFSKAVDYLLETNSLTNAAMFKYGFKLGLLLGLEVTDLEED